MVLDHSLYLSFFHFIYLSFSWAVVYNIKSGDARLVKLIPEENWGGAGLLGMLLHLRACVTSVLIMEKFNWTFLPFTFL